VVRGTKYTPTATATSTLPVTFVIDAAATAICSISGGQVSFLAVGTCVINANQAGNANYDAAAQVQQSFSVGQGTPVITWSNPTPISPSTALSGTQLNATASVPGVYVYTPPAGTTLTVGTHTLHVDFTPTDTVNYKNASKDVTILVTNGGGGGGGGGGLGIPAITASDGTLLDKVAVTWTPVDGATYYLAYRSATLDGDRKPVGGYQTTETGGVDIWAAPGVTYYYWVQACNINGCGALSAYDTGWRGLAAPVVTASQGAFADKVVVTWPAVDGATSYLAYRSTSLDGAKVPANGYYTLALSGEDTWSVTGVTYYYWVKACNGLNCSDWGTAATGWR
jgi:hypothetical protein